MNQHIHTGCVWEVAVSWSSCVQIAVVLIFLIAIILYRTILSIIIYKSGNSFVSFSVSTTQHSLKCFFKGDTYDIQNQ